ncbi:MAG: glycerate kinase [Actinomycetota bacterium]
MRVLVAPDKFRGTLTARQAAEAIETGWRRARPDDDVDLVPMADGGEGTLDALVDAQGGRLVATTATGPLGDPVDAAFGIVETADGLTGVVESARASGLALLGEGRRDPLRTTTRGTGELILAALSAGARRVVVCLGGSATNDGGVGMAAALGIRFLDVHGRDVADGGAALLDLARIDGRGQHPAVAGATFLGATDVENPLCGPAGASHVYGPQKGASPDDVFLLDRALAHLAAVVHHDLGIALKDEPGAGAAGGLGFGLLAFCGARLRRGVDVVMEAVDLDGRMEGATLVITGEGSLDTQSLYGKVPAGVIRLARLHSVPVAVLCGRSEVTPDGVTVRSLVDRVGEDAALGDARRSLEVLASELAVDLPAGVVR